MLSSTCINLIENDLLESTKVSFSRPLNDIIVRIKSDIRLHLKTLESGIENKYEAISLLKKINKLRVNFTILHSLGIEEKHYEVVPIVGNHSISLENSSKINYNSSKCIPLKNVSDENLFIQLNKVINDLENDSNSYSFIDIRNFAIWHLFYWFIAFNRILAHRKIIDFEENDNLISEDEKTYMHQILANELKLDGCLRKRWDSYSSLSIFDLDIILKKVNGDSTLKNTINYLLEETSFFNFRSNNFNRGVYNYLRNNTSSLTLDFESYFYLISIGVGLKNIQMFNQEPSTDVNQFHTLKREQAMVCGLK